MGPDLYLRSLVHRGTCWYLQLVVKYRSVSIVLHCASCFVNNLLISPLWTKWWFVVLHFPFRILRVIKMKRVGYAKLTRNYFIFQWNVWSDCQVFVFFLPCSFHIFDLCSDHFWKLQTLFYRFHCEAGSWSPGYRYRSSPSAACPAGPCTVWYKCWAEGSLSYYT